MAASPIRPSCGLESYNNSAERLVLAIDSWPGTGIGHSIPGSARWLRLATALASTDTRNPRALRLAACVPRALREIIGDARVATCEDPHFDIARFLTFGGIKSLRATEENYRRVISADTLILRKPSCETLLGALGGLAPLVVVVRMAAFKLEGCLKAQLLRPRGEFECTSEARLTEEVARPLPPCEVGLHLRTLAVDDPLNCNLLSNKVDNAGCKFKYRGSKALRSCDEAFPTLAEGCGGGGARFATADTADAYKQTRAIGWADLNESAQRTWFGVAPWDGARLGQRYQLRDSVDTTAWASTVAAWLTLARCKRG